MSTPITVQDIRDWMFDRTLDDNEYWGDLVFTDEEITKAMKHAVRSFMMVPPIIPTSVNPAALPSHTPLFFDATVEALYKMKRHSLGRNRFKYEAGNVSVNDSELQLEFLDRAIKEIGASWRQEAQFLKSQINVSGFYGQVY